MGNDSTHKEKSTPAPSVAEARHEGGSSPSDAQQTNLPAVKSNGYVADARPGARLHLYREGGIESTGVDNKQFYRDVDLGKMFGLSRPRDLRKTIVRMIERGDIGEEQYILLDDDDAQIYYVDRSAAMRLAFRSNAGDSETLVMRVLSTIPVANEAAADAIPRKEAMTGYQRTLAFISKKDTPRESKVASVPLLERYARAAGLPIPDVAALVGPSDQPRLPGV